jgi:hypothetical protein
MTRIAAGLLSLGLLCLPGAERVLELTASAQDAAASDKFVTVCPGSLPIILSTPHGGRERLAGVPPRQGIDVKQFVIRRDEGTAELAEKLAAALERRLPGKAHLVIDRVER